MRIPTERLDLKELGYEDYFVVVPKTITEGWLYDFQLKQEEEEAAEAEENGAVKKGNAQKTRESMITVLELVTEWNLDGTIKDKEGVLPLIKDLPEGKGREEVVRQIPIDVLLHVMTKVTSQQKLKELTKDFSSAS